MSWSWLLSERQREVAGLPSVEDVERRKLYGLDSNNLLAKREKSKTELPKKRKASSRSIIDEATTSRSRDVSPQRKKLRFPSATSKSPLRGVPSVENIPIGIVVCSSAGIKHLVDANSKKVNGM
ncbi:hypothetical protein GBA52_026641 [Prunus armeniaca]|nr:hypothetical protein GBA52_026641 [Prunus armeniaca]